MRRWSVGVIAAAFGLGLIAFMPVIPESLIMTGNLDLLTHRSAEVDEPIRCRESLPDMCTVSGGEQQIELGRTIRSFEIYCAGDVAGVVGRLVREHNPIEGVIFECTRGEMVRMVISPGGGSYRLSDVAVYLPSEVVPKGSFEIVVRSRRSLMERIPVIRDVINSIPISQDG